MSPLESQAALRLLSYNVDQQVRAIIAGLRGSPEQVLAQLLEIMPELVRYYSDGSATLAADLFDELRSQVPVRSRFRADPVVNDRTVKIRNAVVWAVQSDDTNVTAVEKLTDIAKTEVARPYRDTITLNSRRDPDSVGWSRVAGDSCGFCRMLSARGAVYKRDTARFAAHQNCDCTARPVFYGGEVGPEASAIQYMASRRSKTPAQRAALNEYLATYYPD